MGKPYISTHAFVPTELLRGPRAYEAHKEILTVRPRTYMDSDPVEMLCYNDSVDGYLGLPIEWALHPSRYGDLHFEDRTTTGTKLINASKDVDYTHPSSPRGQENFVKKIISVLDDNYSCFAVADTGCHTKGTKVIKSDGKYINVEDIKVGDTLLGIDSKPKQVLKLVEGTGKIYKITPKKGKPFYVNEDHILCLKTTPEYKGEPTINLEVSVKNYLGWSPRRKHLTKLYRPEFVDYPTKEIKLDPYFLGLMLGDGGLGNQINFTNSDIALRNYLEYYRLYNIKSEDKFIPDDYKYNSKAVRQCILAGLLDTDGSMVGSGFEYTSKSLTLVKDIKYLSHSLGFYCSEPALKEVKGQSYYRININGDLNNLPLTKKVPQKRNINKNLLVTGFDIEYVGEDSYYGFTVQDHLYMLEDFIVTHNCGKTVVALAVASHYNTRTLIICDQTNLINQFYKEALLHLGLPKSKVAIVRGKGGVNMHAPVCIGSIKSLVQCNYPQKFFDSFGMVIFDECHSTTSAVTYSTIFNKIRPTYRLALTATENRKDGADKALKFHLGPKRAQLEGQSMPCKVYVYEHNENYDYWGTSPSSHISQLAKNKKRNKKIVKLIIDRFKAKRHILVMSERIDQLEKIKESLINLGVPDKYVGLYTGSKTVNGKRKTLKDEQVSGYLKTARILLTTYNKGAKGLNVKRLDCLIEATPRSDGIQPPGRVRRFLPGKPIPEVHTIVDMNNFGFKGRFKSRLSDYKKLKFEVVYVPNFD